MAAIEEIRTLISRGKLEQVQQLIEDAMASPEAQQELSRRELLLEEARLHALNGEWEASSQKCGSGLRSFRLSALTSLALLQVLGLCLYEQGKFAEAYSAIEKGLALGKLFQNAPAYIYCHFIRSKIEAQTEGVARAEEVLFEVMRSLIIEDKLNLDYLVAFPRLQADFRRMDGGDSQSPGLAALAVCGRLGASFYRDLTEFELFGRTSAAKRVCKFREEIFGQALPTSTSAKALKSWLDGHSFFEPPALAELPRVIIIGSLDLLVDIAGEKPRFCRKKISPQLQRALKILKEGPIRFDELFRKLWGHIRYVPGLHHSNLRTLVYRLRKVLPGHVEIFDGRVLLRQVAVLE